MTNYDNHPDLYNTILKEYKESGCELYDQMFAGYVDTYVSKLYEGD